MNNYETEEFIREKISPKLKEGEQILWCGATASDATRKERGIKRNNYISMAVYFVLLTCLAMKFMDISQYPDKKDIIVPMQHYYDVCAKNPILCHYKYESYGFIKKRSDTCFDNADKVQICALHIFQRERCRYS